MEKDLIKKIQDKSALIGIVGLGYVGLPLALGFMNAGFKVLGLDVGQDKVDKLRQGQSYIAHIDRKRIEAGLTQGLLEASTDFSQALRADTLIICVPTPLNEYREPDLSYVVGTLESLLPHLRAGQMLSLESTTYPGTTQEILRPPIEARGFTVGEDFFLVYSPEREDPANPDFHTRTIPKVMGGSTPACARVGQAVYGQVVDRVVLVSSTIVAELTKLLENIYRSVNIGLVNELKMVTDKMGADIYEIINAAATKPFGFTPFYPGPGLGGHCIPIDPFYLTWKARAYGVNTRFIELAGEVNQSMPDWVVRKTMEGLNQRGQAVKGSKLLILGLAYKKNVDDMRESPSVEIIEKLGELGATVSYNDPYLPEFPNLRRGHFNMNSVPLTPGNLASFNAAILVTDHDNFDYNLILQKAPLIIDTRGKFPQAANVIKA